MDTRTGASAPSTRRAGTVPPGLRAAPTGGRRALRLRRRRGVDLLEFMFVLPFLLFFMLFTFDIGRISLMSGMLHDATNQAARVGSQVGGGCLPASTSGAVCNEATANAASPQAFRQAMTGKPLIDPSRGRMQVTTGSLCRTTGTNLFVTVNASYDAELITPGLPTLLGLTVRGGPWRLEATAVARCEIVR
jgi:Flp pilus assembly protein TadG